MTDDRPTHRQRLLSSEYFTPHVCPCCGRIPPGLTRKRPRIYCGRRCRIIARRFDGRCFSARQSPAKARGKARDIRLPSGQDHG